MRRVIELAVPHLLGAARASAVQLVLVGGEPPAAGWLAQVRARLGDVPVTCWIEPALGYVAEQRLAPRPLRQRISRFLTAHLPPEAAKHTVVWMQNPGLGRNLALTQALIQHCGARGIPLVLHHHDWWFDNRWHRWPELRQHRLRSLNQVAECVFAGARTVRHAVINRADFTVLACHLRTHCGWLPNPVERTAPPPAERVRTARRWLVRQATGARGVPVWLVASRFLRRKNLAEAVLLTRWLRPGAWLVTTGGASSAEEQPCRAKLEAAVRAHGWRVRFGVLAADESRAPAVPELMAASEVLLLTSIQEGFGLPYLEAAEARRPLIARLISQVAPDLEAFGFRFPQGYTEVRVPTALFDWSAERRRQRALFDQWRRRLPVELRPHAAPPAHLESAGVAAVAFSRLTLTGQLEILALPPEESWSACVPLNPALAVWRRRAERRALQVTPWPRRADQILSGPAYAARFWALVRRRGRAGVTRRAARAAQRAFLARTLAADNQFPLLWDTDT